MNTIILKDNQQGITRDINQKEYLFWLGGFFEGFCIPQSTAEYKFNFLFYQAAPVGGPNIDSLPRFARGLIKKLLI